MRRVHTLLQHLQVSTALILREKELMVPMSQQKHRSLRHPRNMQTIFWRTDAVAAKQWAKPTWQTAVKVPKEIACEFMKSLQSQICADFGKEWANIFQVGLANSKV